MECNPPLTSSEDFVVLNEKENGVDLAVSKCPLAERAKRMPEAASGGTSSRGKLHCRSAHLAAAFKV
jgi:hypothetical protein